MRYGRQYTKECDINCEYAKAVKEGLRKDEIIEHLLSIIEEMNAGMRNVAAQEVKNKFGIEY